MRRALCLVVASSLALVSCGETAGDTGAPPMPAAMTTTTAITATAITTTAAAITTGTAAPVSRLPETPTVATVPESAGVSLPVPLEGAVVAGSGLEWMRADVALDREREHWLGEVGGTVILLSWSPSIGDVEVRRSTDGTVWSEAEEGRGLPEGFVPYGPDSPLGPSGGPHGVIMGGTIGGIRTAETEPLVAVSTDGGLWTVRVAETFGGEASAAAAGSGGFAVIGSVVDRGRSGAHLDPALWVSPNGLVWQAVAIPEAAETVAVIGNAFVVARSDRLWQVDAGVVTALPSPLPSYGVNRLIAWQGDLVMWATGAFPPVGAVGWRSALLAHRGTGWLELPFPVAERSRLVFGGAAWAVQSLDAGNSGIAAAAFEGGEYWDFHGESFPGISLGKGGYEFDIDGDSVSLAPFGVDSSRWFDRESGSLTVPGADGEPLFTVTCDEMRDAVRTADWVPEELVETPAQTILFSPDGAAWQEQQGAELFGEGAYVFQVVVVHDRVVAFLQLNGERPIADPPGCPLGLYPEELPYEIWVGMPVED